MQLRVPTLLAYPSGYLARGSVEQATLHRRPAQPTVAVIDGTAAYHITQLLELHRSLLIHVTTCTPMLCNGSYGTVQL